MTPPRLADRLRKFVEASSNLPALCGPEGPFIKAWRSRDTDADDRDEWSRVHDIIASGAFARRVAEYYSGHDAADDIATRHINHLIALTAIRLGRGADAELLVGARASFWDAVWRGSLPLQRHEMSVPVVAVTDSERGEILELKLQHVVLEDFGVFETPEMALLAATPRFLDTLSRAAPEAGAFVWSLRSAHAQRSPSLVDGESAGGAIACAFALLEQRGRYDRGVMVLATRKFGVVGGLPAKVEAVLDATTESLRRFQQIVVPMGAAIDDALRERCDSQGIVINPVTGLDAALEAVRVREMPATGGADPDAPPYPGPQPFSEEQAPFFFGRRNEADALVALLESQETRIVLIYAPSGAGKSSLLNAAVRPRLATRGFVVLPTARLNNVQTVERPRNAYTHAALLSIRDESDTSEPAPDWKTHLARTPTRARRLLVLDQLEEIETGPITSHLEKVEFFNDIRDALDAERGLTVLLCFREEYLASISRYIEVDNGVVAKRFPLDRLQWKGAAEAITQPAKKRGVEFTEQALADLRSALVDRSIDRVEPLLLQLMCTRIWHGLRSGARQIGVRELAHVVGLEPGTLNPAQELIARIIDDFCREAIEAAAAQPGALPRDLIRLGIRQFVTPAGRRSALQEVLAGTRPFTGDLPTSVLRELCARSLLRGERRQDSRLIELAHDRLVAPVLALSRVSDSELLALFDHALTDVANRTGVEPSILARESLLALVSIEGARRSVPRTGTIRLFPHFGPAARQGLARAGVLRPSREDPEEALELTHAALATALVPRRAEAWTPYYRTRQAIIDRLSAEVGAGDPHLGGRFTAADDFVGEALDLVGLRDLDADECELVLRCSLASGHRLAEIAPHLASHYPDVAQRSLAEAARVAGKEAAAATVRLSAARAFALVPVPDRIALLLALALDSSRDVRREAASTLGLLDDSAAWSALKTELTGDRWRGRAIAATAWIRDDTYSTRNAPNFERWWDALPHAIKLAARRRLFLVRAEQALPRLALATIVGILSTMLFVVPMRAAVGYWGGTVTQLTVTGITGFVESGFLGLSGAAILGAAIAGALLSWWFVVEGRAPMRRRGSSLWAGIVGGAAGFAGGVLVSLAMGTIYGPPSLESMGWVRAGYNLADAFTGTGLGWALPFSGTVVGFGVGLSMLSLVRRWRRVLASESIEGPFSPMSLLPIYWKACRLSVATSWRLLLMLLVGAGLFRLFLATQVIVPHVPGIEVRLLGDYLDIAIGGVGLVAGLLTGLFIMEHDVDVGGIRVSRLPGYALEQLAGSDHVSSR
jgi:hypothetical protein